MIPPNWLLESLRSADITDICLNGGRDAYVDRGRGLEKLPEAEQQPWREEDLKAWVVEQISLAGKSWDAKHPFVDASLQSGHRLHAVFPPVAGKFLLLSLRRLPTTAPPSRRWSGSPAYDALAEAVKRGDSVLISGPTGSGKTTLATDLLAEVPHSERIIALEDTPELAPNHPHFLSLVSRPPNADGCGEVTLRTLLKQTLRMRPDRVMLGECRGPEMLELLQALNTGHRGAMATLHANSPRDALRRVELLCLLAASGTLPIPAIRELLAHGVQWVAQVARHGGTRQITEVHRIEGREGDTILMRPVIQAPHESHPRLERLGASSP